MWKRMIVLWLGTPLLWAVSAAAQEEETPELEVIVVTATRAERDLLDTPGSATVIDREALQEEGGADIGDVVHETEGVDVLRYGGPGSSTTAHLRGTYGVHTLVLVDGRTQNAPSRGSADLSGLSPAFVEQIEIVRGPASALYGTGAVGGVLQVFTRDIPEEPINEAYVSLGSFGSVRASSGTDQDAKLPGGESLADLERRAEGFEAKLLSHAPSDGVLRGTTTARASRKPQIGTRRVFSGEIRT